MTGRPQHSQGRRQGHRSHRAVSLRVEKPVMPAAPDGILKLTRDRWKVYWSSDLSRATRDAHLPIVERLFYRYDERERAYRAVRKKGRVVEGSQGQLVQHPLLKYIDACDAEIRQLEDRLGLSPRGLARLGSSFAPGDVRSAGLDAIIGEIASDFELEHPADDRPNGGPLYFKRVEKPSHRVARARPLSPVQTEKKVGALSYIPSVKA